MSGAHRGMGIVDEVAVVPGGSGRHAAVRVSKHVGMSPPVLVDATNPANTGPLGVVASHGLRNLALAATGAVILVTSTSQLPIVRASPATGLKSPVDTGQLSTLFSASLVGMDYPSVEIGTSHADVRTDVPSVEVPAPGVAAAPPLSTPVNNVVPATAPVAAPAPVAQPVVVVPPVPVRAPVVVAKTPAPVPVRAPAPVVPAPVVQAPPGKSQAILSSALSQLGVFQDCTMLVTNSLRAAGISFHGWPAGYLGLGRVVTTTQAVAGDLIYYANGGMGVAHIAVYIGGGMAVHGGWNGNQTVKFSAYVGSGPVFIHVA